MPKPKGYRPGKVDSSRSQGSQPDRPRMVDQPASYYTLANVCSKSQKPRGYRMK